MHCPPQQQHYWNNRYGIIIIILQRKKLKHLEIFEIFKHSNIERKNDINIA